MNILLTGGGSGGPVAPLLAVAEEIKKTHPKARFLMVGTHNGPEREMATPAGVEFVAIRAGKWRRYFSLANFMAPFLLSAGFFESLLILKRFRPDCIFGAGSFVQVPVVWAAWFLKIPVVLHQQDITPSLANTICQMVAKRITVSFESSIVDFSSNWGIFYKKHREDKVVLTGNPCRFDFAKVEKAKAIEHFHLIPNFPTLFVVGGGGGADFLNQLIAQALPQLSKTVQIIHATGKNKTPGFLKLLNEVPASQYSNYHQFEFIAKMELAYAAADIVLCRAGMSTITELSNLKKTSIIVPMPHSHQEQNAMALFERRAALVFDQANFSPSKLTRVIRKLLFDLQLQETLKENIGGIMLKNSAKKIGDIIVKLAEKSINI